MEFGSIQGAFVKLPEFSADKPFLKGQALLLLDKLVQPFYNKQNAAMGRRPLDPLRELADGASQRVSPLAYTGP